MAPCRVSGASSAPQPCYRGECPEPRTRCSKKDVDGVFRIADYRKSRQQIPDGAPVRGPNTTSAGHGSVEEHVGCICRSGGGEHAHCDERVDWEDHAGVFLGAASSADLRRSAVNGFGPLDQGYLNPAMPLRASASARSFTTSPVRLLTPGQAA